MGATKRGSREVGKRKGRLQPAIMWQGLLSSIPGSKATLDRELKVGTCQVKVVECFLLFCRVCGVLPSPERGQQNYENARPPLVRSTP